jgi:hypothetical protein
MSLRRGEAEGYALAATLAHEVAAGRMSLEELIRALDGLRRGALGPAGRPAA